MFKRKVIAASVEAMRAPYRFDGEETFTQAQVDELVAGLKTSKEAILAEKKAVQAQLDEVKTTLSSFDGINPTKVKEMMAKFENDDEAKLIAEGKVSEVINARVAKTLEEADAQIKAATDATAAAEAKAGKFSQKVLDDSLRAAAMAAGLYPKAIEDALLAGRIEFKLDEEGNAVQFDENNNIIMGKDGKTPYAPAEWLEGMPEKRPHWFPNGNSGSPDSSGDRNSGGGKTIKRAAFEAQNPQERAATIAAGIVPVD